MFMLCTDCAPVTKAESLGPELTSTLANFQKYMSENTVKFGLVLVLLGHSLTVTAVFFLVRLK